MAQVKKYSKDDVFRVSRGWGAEFWFCNSSDYCGKLLHITKGKRGSLHFHVKKLETMLLISGSVTLRFIDPHDGKEYSHDLKPFDSLTIQRGQVHQIIGNEDSQIIEFSTEHDEADSFRVQKGD